ncbi:MAG: T9SS type A sorting domain-containing protein, partial [Rhodothermia bacterium]|nr:T9SS type A sorting domain-containing protein [Rhodothermia bacterium]
DYDWSHPEWAPSLRTSYNEAGLISAIDGWDPISKAPTPIADFYYEYAYDFSNLRQVVSLEIEREWDGVAWQNASRTVYDVESDPSFGMRVVGGQTDRWAGGDWSPVEQFSFYEMSGSVFQEYRAWEAGLWMNKDRIVFPDQTIASLENRLVTLHSRYGEYVDLYLATLLLPPNYSQEWTGSEWENTSRYQIESYHFVAGEPAVIQFDTWDQGNWVDELRVEFHFGQFNNNSAWRIDGANLQILEHNGWTPISAESYEYDGRNLLVQSVRRDGLFGIFVNTARISFNWIGLSVGREDPGSVPVTHVLRPAYPNPFNTTTTITYELAATDDVRIELRDMLGRLVEVYVDERQVAGSHDVVVEARDLPSGIYAVRMLTPHRVQTQLLTLVK